jgi:pilus assembly protein CpaC
MTKRESFMKRISKFLPAMALFIGLAATSVAAGAAEEKFYVPVDRSEVISTTAELGEVIVANPDVADIYVHGTNRVSIIGRTLGQTSVRMFDKNNKMVRELDVYVTYDLPAIRRALSQFLPYERIGVEMVNTRVALTGEVSSAQAATSALEIASQFIIPSIRPDQVAGSTDQQTQLQDSVINLMRISAAQQVMLRIRIGEIKRGALKELGSAFEVVKNSGDLPFSLISGSGTAGAASKLLQATYANGTKNSVSATIDALQEDNLLKILAEPNLVALSGEQAEFLAGGEVPIPVSGQDGEVTVDYRPFGVSLRFTPYVLSRSRIRIMVQPEVSERNDTNSVSLGNGIVVPSFDVRRASTTVELAPGESFMIAGLLQDTVNSSISGLPGASEVPFLGSLFRSTSFNRQETELVLAVTPYLIDPLKSADVRLPTDDFRPASFMESFLYGALGTIRNGERRISQTPTLEGPIGFMVD